MSSLFYYYMQIKSDWNITIVKLLILIVFFTGVFRTTCVTENQVGEGAPGNGVTAGEGQERT